MKIIAIIIRYCKMKSFHDNLFIITGNGEVMSSAKCFISLDVYDIVRLMTHWLLKDATVILNHIRIKELYIENFLLKCLQENATRHWWLVKLVEALVGAIRQQASTWINVQQVLWCHI